MIDEVGGELACSYLRVSTTQQAQHDISLPDQRNRIEAYAKKHGLQIVAEFVEPGASARTDQRPVFQDMMTRALANPPEFRVILVHSMSRLFRDEMYLEIYRRKLDRKGVRIISITQDFGEGPSAELARRFQAIIDEVNSMENAKHVQRAMQENARQNFWNGSSAPLGYRTVVAEMRGQKQKKRLEIEPDGAETIRLIFNLYLEGDGTSGPLGIKNITSYLNARGFKTPKGNPFHISFVQKILTDEVYVGRSWYNVWDTKLKAERPKQEWIAVTVPPIITEENFQRVQALLTLRSPKITAPRLVNSPILLTGIARCGGCGGPLRRETGKGGKYSYYRCSTLKRTGSCNGMTTVAGINADFLDQIVLSKVADRILTAERVKAIVTEVAIKREAGLDQAAITLRQLREQRANTARKLNNLMKALADGVVESSDTFKTTMKATEGDARRIADLIAAQESILSKRLKEVTLEEAAEFAVAFREKLLSSGPALQKRIIRSFVKEVIVSEDEIAILGTKSDLAEIVTGGMKYD